MNPFIYLCLFALSWGCHLVSCHYILTAPPTRGMIEEKLTQAPCGSFNTPSTNRNNWTIGTPIGITAYHANADFKIYVSLKPNPSSISDFSLFGNSSISNQGKQTVNFALDKSPDSFMKGLNINTVNELIGKEATIMTVFDAGDGVLYQCGDVKFVSADSNSDKPNSGSVMINNNTASLSNYLSISKWGVLSFLIVVSYFL